MPESSRPSRSWRRPDGRSFARNLGAFGAFHQPEVSMKSVKTIVVLCALGLAVPGTALAAGPTATTGNATAITANTATLNGSVDPNHNATTFHFEYGRTTAYGSRTTEAGTDATKRKQPVSAAISGLAPAPTC